MSKKKIGDETEAKLMYEVEWYAAARQRRHQRHVDEILAEWGLTYPTGRARLIADETTQS